MLKPGLLAAFLLLITLWAVQGAAAAKKATSRQSGCRSIDNFFADEVWAKVGERLCLKCHNAQGKASKSRLLLVDTSKNPNAIVQNHAAFVRIAQLQKEGKSRLLVKVKGGLDHGGGVVLQPGTTGYRILERFVHRLNGNSPKTTPLLTNAPPFFKGVQMMSPERLLRRVTLSLASRLPSKQEQADIKKNGLKAMDRMLDRIMKEEAFYDRLMEGFNDTFLMLGFRANGEELLSYDHFNRTRLWYNKFDLSHLPQKERQRARWRMADVYRQALRREPLEMIAHIVRKDRPFTDLVTADYIMVSPYTARGYGVFEQARPKFKNPKDPFDYVPVRLNALKSRREKVQKSATGYYPHAGILSTFQYVRRFPTTETNRNRLRARMYYQHFLGIDVMALAPRVSDAAAITAKYEIPTMQAPDCVVCHRTVDPVAGLFQDYNKEGHFGPRKEGWYKDMFVPGFEGEKLPKTEQWRALQWLGQRTASDPRFATAMVQHAYYILMGRKALKAPEDINDPLFEARYRAYQEQRKLIEKVAQQFVKARFNLKVALKAIVLSDFYRADGLTTVLKHPCRPAELADIGVVRLLTPEMLERKIEAIFGQKWNRLVGRESRFQILYGGIDSDAVTERITEPSGVMGAIQRIMSNDVACKNVVHDFAKKPSERKLFPHIEPSVVPGKAKADAQIRNAIVHLHERILGRRHTVNHPEVRRTYQLFASIVSDAKEARGIESRASYFCGRVENKRVEDRHYTLRAWRAVVTYLLRQHDFLYE